MLYAISDRMDMRNMYKPKQENVEKLDRYIEKLKKDGKLSDDCPYRKGDSDRGRG